MRILHQINGIETVIGSSHLHRNAIGEGKANTGHNHQKAEDMEEGIAFAQKGKSPEQSCRDQIDDDTSHIVKNNREIIAAVSGRLHQTLSACSGQGISLHPDAVFCADPDQGTDTEGYKFVAAQQSEDAVASFMDDDLKIHRDIEQHHACQKRQDKIHIIQLFRDSGNHNSANRTDQNKQRHRQIFLCQFFHCIYLTQCIIQYQKKTGSYAGVCYLAFFQVLGEKRTRIG